MKVKNWPYIVEIFVQKQVPASLLYIQNESNNKKTLRGLLRNVDTTDSIYLLFTNF